ncbi:MAG: hypothetical protein H6747_05060 [Deltaproteobacteria bacterium]|nr:hypothetical protein [Deltaproteobacteria bacterium]
MERVVHKTTSHQEAARHDRCQMRALGVEGRQAVARELERRAYGGGNPDLREAEGRGRGEPRLEGTEAPRTLSYIGLVALLAAKRAAGRAKDLDDIEQLTGARDGLDG